MARSRLLWTTFGRVLLSGEHLRSPGHVPLDPDLDLEGLEHPKIAHHTFRRTSDKFARDHSEITGASKDDIDEQYGWLQAERSKDMQTAYAGPRSRAHRARITMMI